MADSPPWKTNFNKLLSEYKKSARKRNIEWKLTDKEFMKLTKGRCYICQVPPSNLKIRCRQKKDGVVSPYVWNGIDRIDSSKPYELSNCRSCCSWCNTMKWSKDHDEFLEHVKKINEVNQ